MAENKAKTSRSNRNSIPINPNGPKKAIVKKDEKKKSTFRWKKQMSLKDHQEELIVSFTSMLLFLAIVGIAGYYGYLKVMALLG